MSELDRFFGECEKAVMPELHKTNWPHAEEHIRPILDCFQEHAGFNPIGDVRNRWIAGARQWYSVFGEETSLLRLAIEQMQKDNLTIATPRSCIMVALDIKKRLQHPGVAEWMRKPCKKCWTFHHPDGLCAGEEEDED